MENQAYTLRAIAKHAGVPTLREVAQTAGLQAAYRITVHYHDLRARDSVATLVYTRQNGAQLGVVFLGALAHKPLQHTILQNRYEAFVRSLQMMHFDALPDQAKLPAHSADLWLVERAAGSFLKSVILAPDAAEGSYQLLANVIREYLPAALKVVSL
jgi:hypothetical protein